MATREAAETAARSDGVPPPASGDGLAHGGDSVGVPHDRRRAARPLTYDGEEVSRETWAKVRCTAKASLNYPQGCVVYI